MTQNVILRDPSHQIVSDIAFSLHAQTTIPTGLRTNEAGWNFCLDVPRYWLSSLRFQLV